MSCEEKINKIIELLRSPDLDDYECCIEIAKVVGIYNYERKDNRDWTWKFSFFGLWGENMLDMIDICSFILL